MRFLLCIFLACFSANAALKINGVVVTKADGITFSKVNGVTGTLYPSLYGTVAAWYAVRKETAYNNSDPMGTLTDWSGNARNATASTTARPTYVTGVVNGLPSARFDGVANVMVTSSVAWGDSLTVFCVFKFITKTVNFARAVEVGANNQWAIAHWTGSVGDGNLQWGTGAGLNVSGYNAFTTSSFVGTSSTGDWWKNGSSVGSNTGVTGVSTGSVPITFANFGGGGSFFGNIDFEELIIYTGTVTSRTAIEDQLRLIYGHY